MKEIIPYHNPEVAMKELDNGGRFYNLFTKADDGKVTSAELGKAAGVFSDKQRMILYLEMAIDKLDQEAKPHVINSLSEDLKTAYDRYSPQHLLPSEAKTQGNIAGSTIITGIPEHISNFSGFDGFIIVPVISNNSMVMMMIPIFDQYEVYKIYDEEEHSREFIIAHSKGMTLPEKKIKCGGVLKSLKNGSAENAKETVFLETIYYTLL